MIRLVQKPINVGIRVFFRMEKWLYYHRWLKTGQLTFPDFLCIGSQKAGTTWLYENLRSHPELFLPDRKELNYFSSKYRFYGMPLGAYCHYFESVESLKGEVTPCANLPLRRIRFIKTIMPSVKLILIIRNPIERMSAAALMYLVKAQKRAFESIKDEEFYQLFNTQDLFSRGDYPTILKNWRSVFPEDQLHVCFYEDIVHEPQKFLKGVFSFLEVSDDIDLNNFPVNHSFNKSPGHTMPSHIRLHLESLYQESMEKLKTEFPEKVTNWTTR